MLAESLAESCAESSLCDKSLNEFSEAEALAEATLKLASEADTCEVDAEPDND